MHEVFEGNTFEGHTMLEILKRFQQRVGEYCKPVIVADAAMLSTSNMQTLDEQGYCYIVGARLANSAKTFADQIEAQLPRTDGAIRFHVLVFAFEKKNIESLELRAIDLLRLKKSDKPFSLKDPRINRLLPFWQSVFKHLNLTPSYVVASRHTISVMRSLKQEMVLMVKKVITSG